MPKGMRPITTYNVFGGAQTVTKNTTSTSVAFDLREIAQNGYFSIEYLITGDGTLTIAYTVCSTKAGTYFTPTGASSIATGLTKTSGSSGLGGLSFTPSPYPFMKITATETGTSYDAVINLKLNVQ
ncbi:MAG: hypothetical protein WC332_00865 [Clostridia bacterium]|jgi:hypothetical protein